MNDDLMTRLDERGRDAAAAAHAAVAQHPIPDFDPDLVRVALDDDPVTGAAGSRGRRDRRWVAMVGIAAALVVVALGAAMASRTGDDDSAPTDNVGTTDQVRPYVAGWLPEGFLLGAAMESPSGSSDDGAYRMVVLGPEPDVAKVGLLVAGGGTPLSAEEDGLTRVGDAGDHEVFRRDGIPPTYAFDVGEHQVVMLAAEGVDEETVLAVAAGVTLDGEEAVVGDLPEGWESLGVVGDALGGVAAIRGGLGVGQRIVSYLAPADDTGDDGPVAGLTVSSAPGGRLDVAVSGMFGQSEEVDVRGHVGWLSALTFDAGDGDGPAMTSWTLTWEEAPGEIVAVSGWGVDGDDVLAVAEDVSAITEAEWDELVRAATVTPGPDEELVGTGEFSDGSPWALVVDTSSDEPWANLRTAVTDGGGTSSGGGVATEVGPDGEPLVNDQVLRDISWSEGATFAWAYGLLGEARAAEVARVVVEDAEGAVVAEAVLVGDGARRGWVVELPPDALSIESSSADADGDGSSDGSIDGEEGTAEQPATTTIVAGAPDASEDGSGSGLTVVAYAADGSALDRQPLG